MSKILRKFFLATFLIGCFSTMSQAQNDAIVVGQVDSAIARSVRIEFKRNHFLLEDGSFETALDANNTFSFRVKLNESRAVYFSHRNETVRLFLTPGDTLKMHFKSRHLLETMVYDGSAALHNDYLIKAEIQLSEAKNNERAQYSVKNAFAKEHLSFIDSIFAEKKRFYDAYPTALKSDFSNDFLDFILNDNNYWRAYNLMEYVRQHGLTNANPERQVDDNYFAFLYETDNAYYKALNSQNYVQYLELYLGYLREKSGRGKQSDGDTLEIHSRSVQKARSKGKNIRVLEEPYLKNDVVSWLNVNEEAEYQNLSTSEKFKYVLPDTTIEDIFLRVKTPEGRYGWVPESMVNLYDRTKFDTIHRRRFCYQPEKEFCGFEDNLTGKVLYFTMTKDILMGFMYDTEAAMKARMDGFIARNSSYEEYNTTLKSAFQRTILERSRGEKNKVFIPASCEIERYDRDRDYYYATLRKLPLANRVIIDDNSASLASINRANEERLRLASENRSKAEQEAKERISEENRQRAARETIAKIAEEKRLQAEQEAAVKSADENRAKTERENAARLVEETRLQAEREAATRLADAKRIQTERDNAAKLAEANRLQAEQAAAAAKTAEVNRLQAERDNAAKLAEANRLKVEQAAAAAKTAEANRLQAEQVAAAAKIAEAKRIQTERDNATKLTDANRLQAEQAAAAAKIAEAKRIQTERDNATKLTDANRLQAEQTAAAAKTAEAKRLKEDKEAADKLAEETRLWAEQQLKNRLAEEKRIKEEKEAADKLAEEIRLKTERETADKLAEANRKAAEAKAAQDAAQKAAKEAATVSSKVLVGGNTTPSVTTPQNKPLFDQNQIVNANGVKDPNEIVNNPGDKNPANPNEVVTTDGTKMIKQADGNFKVLEAPTQPQTPAKVTSTEYSAKTNDAKKYNYITAKGVELDTTQEIMTLEDRLEFDQTGQFVVFKGMVAGEEMPRFVLTDINGKSVTQEEMKNKVIFIDFWASWCGPCVAQFSHTKILMDKYKNDDVLFLYVSIDADLESWKEYLKENKMAGTHANDKLIVPLNFQVTGIPNSFIIAKNGKIAFNSRLKSKLNDDRVLQVLTQDK
jgi:thiol-disulfide isomerase/thioredoxin